MKRHAAIMIVFLLLTGGCTGQTATTTSGTGDRAFAASSRSGLYEWLDKELLPYLFTELTLNPRLTGRPFLITGFHDEEISTEINGLTSELRQYLKDHLIRTRGINLSWKPSRLPLEHHRSLREVRCVDLTPPEIYIGLNCRLLPGKKKLEVAVRALDLQEERWIDGFGARWSGPATPEQRAALSRHQVDIHFRGLRPMPFTEDQVDLVASYLARNLSCLIKGLGEDVIVYREPAYQEDVSSRTTVDRVFGLVDNYLNKFGEVEIIEQKDKADVVLRQEVQHITNDLYQIWIHSVLLKNGKRLPGTDTGVYLTIDKKIRLHSGLQKRRRSLPAGS